MTCPNVHCCLGIQALRNIINICTLTGYLSLTPLHGSTLHLHAYFEVILDILLHFESIDFVAMAQLAATTKTCDVGK
jgi:hypothetical protein